MKEEISEVEILTKEDSISIIKDNNTMVDYFLFDEFEVHLNCIPPRTKQEWHFHKVIEEIIVVTSGEVILRWKEEENIIINKANGLLGHLPNSLSLYATIKVSIL